MESQKSPGELRQAISTFPPLWKELGKLETPVVLYGMGDGADKVWRLCEKHGIPVAGIFANDAFVRGQSFRGMAVEYFADLEARLGSFTALLCFATQRPEVLLQIDAVARRQRLYAPDFPVFGKGLFTPGYALQHVDKLAQVRSLMSDNQSRLVFDNLLRQKITGEIPCLQECYTSRAEAWQNILRPSVKEHFVDGGAYTGDTVSEFLSYTGGCFASIHGFEPDRRNFHKLEKAMTKLSGEVACYPYGLWACRETLYFNQRSGRNAALAEGPGHDVKAVEMMSLDELLEKRPCTLLKLDVEGAEQEALLGAAGTIRRYRPKLMVSIYHRAEDLFTLPLLVHQLCPDYRLYLRQHPYLPAWDTTLYAVIGEAESNV